VVSISSRTVWFASCRGSGVLVFFTKPSPPYGAPLFQLNRSGSDLHQWRHPAILTRPLWCRRDEHHPHIACADNPADETVRQCPEVLARPHSIMRRARTMFSLVSTFSPHGETGVSAENHQWPNFTEGRQARTRAIDANDIKPVVAEALTQPNNHKAYWGTAALGDPALRSYPEIRFAAHDKPRGERGGGNTTQGPTIPTSRNLSMYRSRSSVKSSSSVAQYEFPGLHPRPGPLWSVG
jgi:hypothetical protein